MRMESIHTFLTGLLLRVTLIVVIDQSKCFEGSTWMHIFRNIVGEFVIFGKPELKESYQSKKTNKLDVDGKYSVNWNDCR